MKMKIPNSPSIGMVVSVLTTIIPIVYDVVTKKKETKAKQS